jgi:hypothetical protein
MTDFTHHPDGRINVQGLILPEVFWALVEPGYALPAGYIGRLFTEGQAHHLIRTGNNTYDQADLNDAALAGYVARKAEYQAAYDAWQDGAQVENQEGAIVVFGPPALSLDKSQIANDSADTVIVTCDLGDPEAVDEIRWKVTAPDGSEIDAVDNAVNGLATWQLTTSFEGAHTVRVETDAFGWAEINFEGV